MEQKIQTKKNTQITYRQEVLRKLIHLSSLWMVAVIYFFPKSIALLIFGILLVGNVFVEYAAYRKWPVFTSIFHLLFAKMLRTKETEKGFHLSGSPYVLAAAFLSALLFPTLCAMFALTVMLIADTAAALIGRKFGQHKTVNGKSLEGAFAFWMAGVIVLIVYATAFNFSDSSMILGMIAVTFAMLAEVYEKQIRLDDNFSIPLICGFLLTLSF